MKQGDLVKFREGVTMIPKEQKDAVYIVMAIDHTVENWVYLYSTGSSKLATLPTQKSLLEIVSSVPPQEEKR